MSAQKKRSESIRFNESPSTTGTATRTSGEKKDKKPPTDIFSQLAVKYNTPLDKDDVVDIRTGEIVEDRGFIRNIPRIPFGALLTDSEGSQEPKDRDTGGQSGPFEGGTDALQRSQHKRLQSNKAPSSRPSGLEEFFKMENRNVEREIDEKHSGDELNDWGPHEGSKVEVVSGSGLPNGSGKGEKKAVSKTQV